jgi:prevent-host-death family protein
METTRSRRIGAFEAKTHLSRILADAEAGIVTVITKRGRPVAILAPADANVTPAAAADNPLDVLRRVRRRSRRGRESLSQLVSAGRR